MDTHPPIPIFSLNLEELRGPSFSTLGGNRPPPLAPLAGATEEIRNKVDALNIKIKRQYYIDKIFACEGNMK